MVYGYGTTEPRIRLLEVVVNGPKEFEFEGSVELNPR